MNLQIPPAQTSAHPQAASNWPDLLMHHDIDFVACAYRTVLGREPDPEGRTTWLTLLRAGHGKIELLSRLRRSDEAQRLAEPFGGFDRLLRWQKHSGSCRKSLRRPRRKRQPRRP